MSRPNRRIVLPITIAPASEQPPRPPLSLRRQFVLAVHATWLEMCARWHARRYEHHGDRLATISAKVNTIKTEMS